MGNQVKWSVSTQKLCKEPEWLGSGNYTAGLESGKVSQGALELVGSATRWL